MNEQKRLFTVYLEAIEQGHDHLQAEGLASETLIQGLVDSTIQCN